MIESHQVGQAEPNMAFCLYAIPGTGKTQFVGTGDNVLIIRPPQDHTVSIRDPGSRNIREIVARTHDDLANVLVQALNGDFDEFDWVWLDSLSLMQDQTLDQLWAQVIESNPSRSNQQIDVATYGINIQRLAQWVRTMAGVGTFNFGVTAHPYWGKNIDDDDLLMPWVQGKSMPEKVCGSMNIVGYMEVRKLKLKGEQKAKLRRVINFNVTERYYAKDQFDAFPNGRLVDPTMQSFMKAVKAARSRGAAKPASAKTRRVSGKKGK